MDILILVDYIMRIVTVLLIGLLSFKRNLVDFSGLLMGWIIGIPIILLGGWSWFIIIMLFHFTAGIATKFKYNFKKMLGVAEEKGGARGWRNVLANGLIALIAVIIERIIGGQIWILGYLGAIAAAMGDTLASEIGVLSPSPPRLITKPWIKVKPGTSGGITLLGYLMVFTSGLTIGVIAHASGLIHGVDVYQCIWIVFIPVLASLAGSTVDSVIGATLQAKYMCSVCGSEVESKVHCGKKTKLVSGVEFIDNNVVNIMCSLTGFLVAVLLAAILGFS